MSEEKNKAADINTDDRVALDWKSRYPVEARKEIRREAVYIGCIFVLAFAFLITNYLGLLSTLLSIDQSRITQFEYIVYFVSAGLLGGIVFGMKYFYRVVARGYWTQDRRYWRILSPFISMSVAFIVGAMASSGILSTYNSSAYAGAVAVGFFAGYFADEAVGKMYELATLLFGKTKKE